MSFLFPFFSAYFLVIHSTLLLPILRRIPPNYFEEYTRDFQLPLGPTLSKSTLEEVYLVVVIDIPYIIIFFLFLAPTIAGLRLVPILALTSMLPSFIRCHTGRFLGAIERCESAICLSLWQYSFKAQSLAKTSYRPHDLPFHRIRTAPSVRRLEHLDISFASFCLCHRRKKRGPDRRPSPALQRLHICSNIICIWLHSCCCWKTWRDQVVVKLLLSSFSSSLRSKFNHVQM